MIARNPDRKVQAAAYKEQIANCEELARFAETVKDPKRLAAIFEKARGKEFVRTSSPRPKRRRSRSRG